MIGSLEKTRTLWRKVTVSFTRVMVATLLSQQGLKFLTLEKPDGLQATGYRLDV